MIFWEFFEIFCIYVGSFFEEKNGRTCLNFSKPFCCVLDQNEAMDPPKIGFGAKPSQDYVERWPKMAILGGSGLAV